MSNQRSGEHSESMDPAPQPSLCSNNCGFFSNPSCNGMCSICYRDFAQKHASQEETKLVKSPVVEAPPAQTLSQHPPAPPSPSLPTAGSPILSIPPPNFTQGRLTSPALPAHSASPPVRGYVEDEKERQQRHHGVDVASGLSQPSANETRVARRRPSRCFTCHRKVGLVGFTCRCGKHFCEQHRLPEAHDCVFDHRGAERQRILEENPVVRSERVKRV